MLFVFTFHAVFWNQTSGTSMSWRAGETELHCWASECWNGVESTVMKWKVSGGKRAPSLTHKRFIPYGSMLSGAHISAGINFRLGGAGAASGSSSFWGCDSVQRWDKSSRHPGNNRGAQMKRWKRAQIISLSVYLEAVLTFPSFHSGGVSV